MHAEYNSPHDNPQPPPLSGDETSALALSAAAYLCPTAGSEALAFMRLVDAEGVWQLVAMRPGSGPVDSLNCRVSTDAEAIIDWVNGHDGINNVYWTTGEIRPGAVQKHKPLGDHVVGIRLAHVDIDLPGPNTEEQLEKLLAAIRHKMPAGVEAFIISSGGGFQLIFVLDQKVPVAEAREAIEALNNGLIAHFGGDKGTWNVERLARLPGPQNIPDAIKRAKGRIQRKAFLLASTDAKYTIANLGSLIPPVAPEETGDRSERVNEAIAELKYAPHETVMSIGDLPIPLADLLDEAMEAQPKIRRALAGDYSGTAAADGSGKRAMVALLLAHHADLTLEDFAMLIWLWAVSAEGIDYAEQKLTPRDIARLYARKVEPIMQGRADRAAERQRAEDGYFDQKAADEANAAAKAENGQAPKLPRRLLTVGFLEAADTALEHSTKPLVQGLLDQSALSVLYGPSNAGKTFVALDIAFHIAMGLPWGGMKTTKGSVLYVAAEGGAGARKRARALQKRFNLEGRSVDIELVLQTINLLDPKADLEPLIATMDYLASTGRPVVFLVIDTFSRVFAGGEENGSTDMGTMVAHFDRIRKATAAHVMIVHHSGKEIARGARGHSLLRAATDTEIEVVPGRIVVTKQRDLEGNYSVDFNLAQIELGKAPDGSPVTSAVVELVSRGAGEPGVATQAEQMVLDAIAIVIEDGEGGEAPQTFRNSDVLAVMEAQGRPISRDGLRQHFRQLVAKRLIKSASRGVYALRPPETPYSQYFQHLTDDEVAKAISEEVGVGSGAGVFG